jgi:hypothetical protein
MRPSAQSAARIRLDVGEFGGRGGWGIRSSMEVFRGMSTRLKAKLQKGG